MVTDSKTIRERFNSLTFSILPIKGLGNSLTFIDILWTFLILSGGCPTAGNRKKTE